MNKPMITLKQAAEMYGLSYYATRQLALAGTIPAIRIGKGKIFVNSDGLAEYLNTARLTDRVNDEPQTIRGIREIGR